MTELLIFTMASVGLSIILTMSRLFKPLREKINKTYEDTFAKEQIHPSFKGKAVWKTFWFLRELFICNLCMGFWSGMFVYLVRYRELSWNIFIFGLIGSIASFTYAEWLDYVKRQ